ncbi:helix-turn-helix domain-containing protein [Mycobacteroides abscessus]|uniref:helix-turn-helix domain-containing protein n=1 Tax=Mycobacteroides abscessus TaxID=36809 RepID=UPI00035C34CE|nr:helix-turn-helix transcriptional regulator [Mycobacteroides abscessus]MBN7421535.1 helix-turn-helix transcriptional regulator [Mycobacteroides abscessus subsp. massiliense]MBN7458397.1 helix-turn-helix transcriptional regulator [Mycobacteroides abscessus subsp. abscessus]MDM2161118.1 helix-turn-helix transcriptional regulator [Mycobacteroides abscessus]MDO3021947.1 helix-turn-helix transcriptional regulator [Mycobacteroides abscessus subsp. abscessus]RIS20138.1 XRE family transcriptional re
MAGKEPDIGPTARAVAANVKLLRGSWTYTELSERLQKTAGWNINAVGIRRIEAEERRVTPDDLVALAVALGVSPATLLMPLVQTVRSDDQVEVTAVSHPVLAHEYWSWITARWPLPGWLAQDVVMFQARALPTWIQEQRVEQIKALFREADEHGDD